jgi:hypothetical protein
MKKTSSGDFWLYVSLIMLVSSGQVDDRYINTKRIQADVISNPAYNILSGLSNHNYIYGTRLLPILI